MIHKYRAVWKINSYPMRDKQAELDRGHIRDQFALNIIENGAVDQKLWDVQCNAKCGRDSPYSWHFYICKHTINCYNNINKKIIDFVANSSRKDSTNFQMHSPVSTHVYLVYDIDISNLISLVHILEIFSCYATRSIFTKSKWPATSDFNADDSN